MSTCSRASGCCRTPPIRVSCGGSPGEAGRRRQDPVAEPDALHSRPYGQNPADPFIADDGWKRGAECVDALCDHEVVRVDGVILDADEDLVWAGSVGLGNVDALKTVDRVAKSCESSRRLVIALHARGRVYCSSRVMVFACQR